MFTVPTQLERVAFSPAEAAAKLGCSRAHVYNLINRGELRAVKLGRSTRISVEELERARGIEVGGNAS